MKSCFNALLEQGIAPVISLSQENKAVPLAKALIRGGITNVEITLRTTAALKCIERIKKEVPDITVSAGTVLSQQNAIDAVSAGADYVVAPGCNRDLVVFCNERSIPIIPGCSSASDIDFAVGVGLEIVKFFPAEASGGLPAINLLSGPYPSVRFLPTGGLDLSNISAYLSNKAVVACGGSYMAKSVLIENEDWDKITENCKRAMDISLGFELAHVGLNCSNESDAKATITRISEIFRFPKRIEGSKMSAGTCIEAMNTNGRGSYGHIGIYCNSCERAKAYFDHHEIKVDQDSFIYNKSGRIESFYLEESIAGFAYHVLTR